MESGLYQKYVVARLDGKLIESGCVVLEFGDPKAWTALDRWALNMHAAGYAEIADDVWKQLGQAEEAALVAISEER